MPELQMTRAWKSNFLCLSIKTALSCRTVMKNTVNVIVMRTKSRKGSGTSWNVLGLFKVTCIASYSITLYGHRMPTGNGIISWMGRTSHSILLPISCGLFCGRTGYNTEVAIVAVGCRPTQKVLGEVGVTQKGTWGYWDYMLWTSSMAGLESMIKTKAQVCQHWLLSALPKAWAWGNTWWYTAGAWDKELI